METGGSVTGLAFFGIFGSKSVRPQTLGRIRHFRRTDARRPGKYASKVRDREGAGLKEPGRGSERPPLSISRWIALFSREPLDPTENAFGEL